MQTEVRKKAKVSHSLIDVCIEHFQNIHTNCYEQSPCITNPAYLLAYEIIRDRRAVDILETFIHSTTLYKTPKDFVFPRDTFLVESFNNVCLLYMPKLIHFRTDIHYEENLTKITTIECRIRKMQKCSHDVFKIRYPKTENQDKLRFSWSINNLVIKIPWAHVRVGIKYNNYHDFRLFGQAFRNCEHIYSLSTRQNDNKKGQMYGFISNCFDCMYKTFTDGIVENLHYHQVTISKMRK